MPKASIDLGNTFCKRPHVLKAAADHVPRSPDAQAKAHVDINQHA
ncbi:hypothetical protein [Acidovorax sp. sic0104]|nr:hypothetical protein [Acidovorax sp. sic0104]